MGGYHTSHGWMRGFQSLHARPVTAIASHYSQPWYDSPPALAEDCTGATDNNWFEGDQLITPLRAHRYDALLAEVEK